jgi:hypothetical protein
LPGVGFQLPERQPWPGPATRLLPNMQFMLSFYIKRL